MLYCFTKSFPIMTIIYNLAFLLFSQFFFSCNQASQFAQTSHLPDSQQNQKRDKTGAANIVFKSMNGGQTWQDISDGLPVPLKEDATGGRDVFFADDNGLWFTDGNGIYHSEANAKGPFWNKDILPCFVIQALNLTLLIEEPGCLFLQLVRVRETAAVFLCAFNIRALKNQPIQIITKAHYKPSMEVMMI